MLAQKSIAQKLILVITVCSALIFTVTIGYFYNRSRDALERELEENARNVGWDVGWGRAKLTI